MRSLKKPALKVKPGESYEEYSERMTDNAVEFIQEQPKSIGQFIISHYMNSQVQTVLVLPTTFRLIDSGIELMGHKSIPKFWEDCCSVDGYIRRLPFWFKWDGGLLHQSLIPILINLLLVALRNQRCLASQPVYRIITIKPYGRTSAN